MFQPLDIFKTGSDGSVLWRGAAEDFVAAKRRIEKLALSSPGEYLILDQKTGQRQRVRVMLKDDSIQARSLKGDGHDVKLGTVTGDSLGCVSGSIFITIM
jgi:hypothetical protein